VTESARGVVRGMHAEDMTKLLTVASGEALGALRRPPPGSPTFGGRDRRVAAGVQVLVPAGVANGFQALTDGASTCTASTEWHPGMAGEACNPLGLGIEWPIAVDPDDPAQLSAKDAASPRLADLLDRLRQGRDT
jgi:dTDP-4-dehydrorhamnose 3,5-epimerase